jgi:hypothetical protein
MITAKIFEVRDRMTFMPVLAVRLGSEGEAERYLLSRAGYGVTAADQARYVLLMRLGGGHGEFNCDPHEWSQATRTIPMAHRYILEHWDELESGDVVDVEYICGETPMPKRSERESEPRPFIASP